MTAMTNNFRLLPLLACLALAGCGAEESGVEVRGRLTQDGKPLVVDPQQREIGIGGVEICFHRIGEDGKPTGQGEMTQADAEGNFDLPDRITPGRYRIAVKHLVGGSDALLGKFDQHNSPIVRQITGGEEIVIDLAKPEG